KGASSHSSVLLSGGDWQVEVAAGETVELIGEIEFTEDASPGTYPLYAFCTFPEKEERFRLAQAIRPAFARGTPSSDIQDRATYAPSSVDNLLDRFFENRRLAIMADYVRSLEEGEGRAFRLGAGPDAFRAMLVPGQDGLLDGYLYLTGPTQDLYFRGISVTLVGPPGVELGEEVEVVGYDEYPSEGGLRAIHQVRSGDWESLVEVEVMVKEDRLMIQARSPDELMEVHLGPVNQQPVRMTGGSGWQWDPGALGRSPERKDWHRELAVEFEAVTVLFSGESPLRGSRESPEEGLASAVVAGGEWLGLRVKEDQLWTVAVNDVSEESANRISEQTLGFPSFWVIDSNTPFRELAGRVKEWAAYGNQGLGLLLEDWGDGYARQGWPPRSDLGTVGDFQELQKACRDTGTLLSVTLDARQISPFSHGFDFRAVAFDDQGMPKTASTPEGELLYQLRPDAAQAYVAEDLRLLRYFLRPSSAFLPLDPAEAFYDRLGRRFPESWVLQTQEALLQKVEEAITQDDFPEVIIREGGGSTGGFILEMVEEEPGLRQVPWFPFRYSGSPSKGIRFAPKPDEITSRFLGSLLYRGGRSVLAAPLGDRLSLQAVWMDEAIRGILEGRSIQSITQEEEAPGRFHLQWSGGVEAWVNGALRPWMIEGIEVASKGFWIEGKRLRAGIVMRDGQEMETVMMPGSWFAHPSGGGIQPIHLEVQGVALEALSDGTGWDLSLSWGEQSLPFDCQWQIGIRSEETGQWMGVARMNRRDGADVPTRVRIPRTLGGGDEPPSGERVEVVLEVFSPFGRPLPLTEGESYLLGVTDLSMEGEALWRPIVAGVIGPEEPTAMVDLGWMVVANGVRVQQSGDEILIYPLPDSGPFPIQLRSGVDLGPVWEGDLQLEGKSLAADEWSPWPLLSDDGGSITFTHQPRNAVYRLTPRGPRGEK
ncbi:MAG: hypothetical protein AAF191_14805, partial [Verrucomicrobiota bacterium]